MVETIELITVKPGAGGWRVACDALGHHQAFASGATAEAAARQLGAGIAGGGNPYLPARWQPRRPAGVCGAPAGVKLAGG